MTLPRRDFLKLSGLAAIATSIEPWSKSMAQTSSASEAKADYTLRIAAHSASGVPLSPPISQRER
jgi:hypothetical protein